MVDRMIRAAKAEVSLYEQVEHDRSLTQEAYTIVGIVAAISAVGALLTAFVTDVNPVVNAVWSFVSVFAGYFIWSFLTYFIGTNVFNGTATYGELQRTLGYAMTPQVLSFIPCVGLLAALWSLYLGIVAVRQALDFDTGKALLTAGLSLLVVIAIQIGIAAVLGIGAAGLGALTG
jgi:hypothetical protein